MTRIARRAFLKAVWHRRARARDRWNRRNSRDWPRPAYAQTSKSNWLRWTTSCRLGRILRKEIIPAGEKALASSSPSRRSMATTSRHVHSAIQSGPDVICGLNNWAAALL